MGRFSQSCSDTSQKSWGCLYCEWLLCTARINFYRKHLQTFWRTLSRSIMHFFFFFLHFCFLRKHFCNFSLRPHTGVRMSFQMNGKSNREGTGTAHTTVRADSPALQSSAGHVEQHSSKMHLSYSPLLSGPDLPPVAPLSAAPLSLSHVHLQKRTWPAQIPLAHLLPSHLHLPTVHNPCPPLHSLLDC